ncbi:MAG: nucleoside hydrolase [Candidatus Limnocylindrales bacterium]|nr:nucleoside hydrolase [Candidatus Limnocylindrales bacterium]
MTPTRPLILDCDPGHDDAVALALALARPELRVLAVTTVAGNAGLDRTTRNALRVLTLLGRTDVPVAAGADRPIVREPWAPVGFHGESGLDGADLPEPAVPALSVTALELATTTLRAAAEPVTIVATGPLTNVALLLRAAPGLAGRIAEISLMGGSLSQGNTTASAEFNIWADPEAAEIVFESGIPIRMAGLDVTHQALMLPPDIARLDGLGTRAGRVFADLMRFFAVHHRERYGWDGPPIHDAVAVAWLADPDLVRSERLRVDVETAGIHTRGRTVADREGLSGRPANADVGLDIDRERLIDLVVDAVGSFR